jgi:hypothetical protein
LVFSSEASFYARIQWLVQAIPARFRDSLAAKKGGPLEASDQSFTEIETRLMLVWEYISRLAAFLLLL